MGWLDGITSAIGSAANYVWDGVTHPLDAISSTAQQIDAASHGFTGPTGVVDYQAWQARQPQSTPSAAAQAVNNFLAPVETPVNNFLNSTGLAPLAANGIGYSTGAGIHYGMTDPGIAPSAPINPDQMLNDALAANPNPTGVNFQTPQNQGGIAPTAGLASPSGAVGMIPIDLSGGAQKSINGKTVYWNGQSWQDTPPVKVGTSSVSAAIQPTQGAYMGPYEVPYGQSLIYDMNGNLRPEGAHYPGQLSPAVQPGAPAPSNSVGTSTVNVSAGPAPQLPPTTSMTQAQWQAAVDAENYKYQHTLTWSPANHAAAINALGPDPSLAPPPAVPATAPTASTKPPLVLNSSADPLPTTTTDPTAAAAAATAAAAGGTHNLNDFIAPAVIGAGGLIGAAGSVVASNTMADAANKATALQEEIFKQQQKNAQPWIGAGTTALDALTKQTADNHQFSSADFQQDPGYAFRLKEGLDALQNSASAHGGLLSGSTLKGITDYGQNAASQEYGNAFNRYMTQRGAQTNALQSLAGIGQSAVQQMNQAGQNYGAQAGQSMQAAGSASASGVMGGVNAINNSIASGSAYLQGTNLVNALLAGKYQGA